MPRAFYSLALSYLVILEMPLTASSQTVWSGYDFCFAKADFADISDPANQDRITDNVWITRNVNEGIFNIRSETFYTITSPDDTEWATYINNPTDTIAATNYENLTFEPWITAYGGQGGGTLPSRLLGGDAVVHLLTDNIYFDLRFTGWRQQGGGASSYDRSLPPATPETTGDYNLDGFVDAADYVHWRKTLNQPAVPAGSGADGDESGTIDGPDYGFWVQRFGNTIMSGSGAATLPEPSAAALAFVWALMIPLVRHHRRDLRYFLEAIMKLLRIAIALSAMATVVFTAIPCRAVFHLWYIKEVYSNHDGSVQFIELFTSSSSQNSTMGTQIETGSGNVYTFGANLTGNTANRHMLLATSTFDAVPNSPTPNFVAFPLPQNFFDPAGDTIEYVGADFKSFDSIPIDGQNSRNWPSFGIGGTTIAHNTPTNFAGTSGHINLPPPPANNGDYNDDGFVDAADYSHWRKFVGTGASPAGSGADGDSDGTVENPDDYNYWLRRFNNDIPGAGGGSGAVPEPVGAVIITSALIVLTLRVRSRL